jgi:prepilin-type processing-associated H-X9-DG protein
MNPRINGAGSPGISSVHGGVANVMWADGHGSSLPDDVRPDVLRQIIERDDGGPADADVP